MIFGTWFFIYLKVINKILPYIVILMKHKRTGKLHLKFPNCNNFVTHD